MIFLRAVPVQISILDGQQLNVLTISPENVAFTDHRRVRILYSTLMSATPDLQLDPSLQ